MSHVTRARLLGASYVSVVAGLAINQVAGAWSPAVVLILLLITLPCGVVAYIAQYPLVIGLSDLIDAPEGSIPVAGLFVAIWTVAALANIRVTRALATRIKTRRARS